jgi:membrane associated rhomboid family serine protease
MGIYDRDYYREDSRWSNPLARSQGTVFLIVLYCAMFIAQVVSFESQARNAAPRENLTSTLELDVGRTLQGEIWRVVSYALIHQPGSFTHLIFTAFFLAWIGHYVEDLYGTREYLAFFAFTSLLGGIAYTVVATFAPAAPPLIGPSGAVTSILVLFALHYPTRRFFYLPIWFYVIGYGLLDVAGVASAHANLAAVAVHLTGAAFALLYHTYTLRVVNWLPGGGRSKKVVRREPVPRLRVRRERPEPEPAATASSAVFSAGKSGSSSSAVDEHLEAKLDEVLAKVTKYGKESLTEGEREILLRASEIYKKRRQSN